MMLIRRLLILLLALALHAAAFAWLMDQPEALTSGDAAGDGDLGVEIGLGQSGSWADSVKRLSVQPEEKPQPPKPVPEPVKPRQPPKPVVKAEVKPALQPVPVKQPDIPPVTEPLPAAATFTVASKERAIEQPEPVAEPVNNQVAEATISREVPAGAPASEARTKASGRADQQSAGGRKGKGKDYVSDLKRWLAQFQEYPVEARKKKQEGVVKLQFSINRQGEVLSAKLYESSGIAELDQAALDMLAAASPLPAAPDDFYPQRDRLTLVIPANYSLITNSSYKD